MPIVIAEDIQSGRLVPQSIDVIDMGDGVSVLRIRAEGKTVILGKTATQTLVEHLGGAGREFADRIAALLPMLSDPR